MFEGPLEEAVEVENPLTEDFVYMRNSLIPSLLKAGDYICLAGQSPVLNFVPNEMYPYIESCVCYRILGSVGDYDGAKFLANDIAVEEKNIKMIIEPRVDGDPTIIINRYGLVRGNKFGQRRWLGVQ